MSTFKFTSKSTTTSKSTSKSKSKSKFETKTRGARYAIRRYPAPPLTIHAACGCAAAGLRNPRGRCRRPARTRRRLRNSEALRAHAYQVERTASALQVSRSWLHARMNKMQGIRKAAHLKESEVRMALETHGGDLRAAAGALQVSERGLQLQLVRLGIKHEEPTVR